MATSGLYGSSPTGGLVAEPGAESSGLYGNSTNFGGTYFQWFIFRESATAPATPTGGSWNFLTNTGTAPAGWTTAPPVNPTNIVWFSISIVNSRNTAALVWTAPAPLVEQGPPGTAATVNAGTTTTGAAGTSASVTNVGTTSAAVFNFVIPRGDTGATGSTGSAATVAAGTTTTGAAGSSATVVNSGTSSAAVFDFTIPRGDTGATGATGATGTAATIAAGTTTTGAAGTSATVTNVGTSSAAIFDFSIPQGAGVITGGTTGQFLAKASNANYDTTWLSITGNLNYQGSWNASTNTPTLTSSVGVNGYYYVVSVSGSTNLNGITDWVVGDWAIFNGSAWQKIDQTNLVTSVAGRTGAVVLANTDISGLGTMSTQNANAVAVTGGSINGTTVGATTASTGAFTTVTASTSLTTPTVQATNSAGLALKNSAGTTQLSMGGGGGDNLSINVSTNINGTNAQIDISPTGTGHVHMKPTGVNSIEIAPTFVGDIDNMIIGATTAAAATVTTLTATADSSFTSTGAVKLSSGTTAERPTGAAGKLRFNTTTTEFEGHNGTSWSSVGGSTIVNDTTTATSVYPLFAASTSGTAATVYTSNAKLLYKPNTGELQSSVLNASNGIVVNSQTVAVSYTIAVGSSGMSSGPVTIASGQSVTVSSGSRWVVV